MKHIGLTGGIGSGKSTVGEIFGLLGIPVYISDLAARQLMDTDEALKEQIRSLLGPEAYQQNGTADRAYIASQVFHDTDLLKQLNAIIHPAVGEDFKQWAVEKKGAPFIIKESAILFEENLTSDLDAMMLVVAPEDVRINRVMQRDGVTADQVRERISKQWPDEMKIPLADYIIYNDGTRSLTNQIKEIYNMIKFTSEIT